MPLCGPKLIVQSRRRRFNPFPDNYVKAIPVLTLLGALVAGAVAWHQNANALRLKEQAGGLAAELASKHAVGQQQETLLNTLQTENDAYRAEVDALRKKIDIGASSPDLVESAQASASLPLPNNNTAEVLAKISDDPKTKEVIRQWNSAKVKQMYGDFVKDHHLSPLQTKQFFDLLTDERIRAKDEYFDLFATGEADTGPTKTRIESWLKQKSEIDRQLRMLLGDDDYAEFEQYRKSEGN